MEEVVQKYLSFFTQEYPGINIPRDSPRACVIVEPRKHPHLEFVMKNVVYFLPHWSLYVFHSKDNEQFVKSIVGSKNVHLYVVCQKNMTIAKYNRLMTSAAFWNRVDAEDILIFQTDSYLRKSGVETFLRYGFPILGAPWRWCPEKHQGGNGGLSLRKKSAMLAIIARFPYREEWAEDVYFHIHAPLLNYSLAPRHIGKLFSIETIDSKESYGAHKPWAYGIGFLDIQVPGLD